MALATINAVEPQRRPLTRPERFLAYGVTGWVTEVVFTALRDQFKGKGDRRLVGETYLWMLPIYGLAAFLFEPVHDRLRTAPRATRAGVYAAGIIATEAATGSLLRRLVGVCPWDYTGRSRFVAAGGATRFDYVPLWALAGLGLERIDDVLRTLPLRRVGPDPAR
jgi:hypothetical protein